MTPVTGVLNPATDEIISTPAFVVNNPQGTTVDSSPNAGLEVFLNPVQGNIDTGVSHEGDVGGAA
jgi:hypothetical protein